MGAFEKLDAVEPAQSTGFNLIPPGRYHFEALTFEEKKSPNGKDYISVRAVIHGPTHAGRQLFSDFWCSTPKATEISKAQLLVIADGGADNKVIGDIVGKHFYADIYIEEGGPKADGSGNWPDRNKLRNYGGFSQGIGEQPVTSATTEGTSDWDAF